MGFEVIVVIELLNCPREVPSWGAGGGGSLRARACQGSSRPNRPRVDIQGTSAALVWDKGSSPWTHPHAVLRPVGLLGCCVSGALRAAGWQ